MNYKLCLEMTEGKTYRIKYVKYTADGVRIATLKFNGEYTRTWDGQSIPILSVLPEDKNTAVGPIYIVAIEEVTTAAELR